MKKLVICPECGYRHTLQVGQRTRSTGVRARRITGNQFEYQITVPETDLEDAGKFVTVTDDLILSGALGVATGGVAGFVAGLVGPEYSLPLIGLGASGGTALAWSWLCAEHNQRLKRVLPWFMEQRDNWSLAGHVPLDGDITLTVDHRYRDGHTEAGRTFNFLGVLPVDGKRFTEYAEAALRGDSLAIKNWTGNGKLFSRNEYDDLLKLLQKAKVVANLPGKGNRLTTPGKHALKHVLEHHHPPTPPRECA